MIPEVFLFFQGLFLIGIVWLAPSVVTAETTEEFRALIYTTQPEGVFSLFFKISKLHSPDNDQNLIDRVSEERKKDAGICQK